MTIQCLNLSLCTCVLRVCIVEILSSWLQPVFGGSSYLAAGEDGAGDIESDSVSLIRLQHGPVRLLGLEASTAQSFIDATRIYQKTSVWYGVRAHQVACPAVNAYVGLRRVIGAVFRECFKLCEKGHCLSEGLSEDDFWKIHGLAAPAAG